MNAMNLDQLRSAFQTGGLRSLSVIAEGPLFFVVAEPQSGERIKLATTRGKQARAFRDPSKAIALLHEIGARKVEVDTSHWSPGEAATGRLRPDTAERQRRAHAAAEYDAWFRAEIEEAIREADDPNTVWVSEEEANAEADALLAKWHI